MGTIGGGIGGKIRKLREAKGWSMAELAEEVGLTYKYVHKLEVGDRSPSRVTVAKLAVVLGVEPQDLLFDAEDDFVREAIDRTRQKFTKILAGRTGLGDKSHALAGGGANGRPYAKMAI